LVCVDEHGQKHPRYSESQPVFRLAFLFGSGKKKEINKQYCCGFATAAFLFRHTSLLLTYFFRAMVIPHLIHPAVPAVPASPRISLLDPKTKQMALGHRRRASFRHTTTDTTSRALTTGHAKFYAATPARLRPFGVEPLLESQQHRLL